MEKESSSYKASRNVKTAFVVNLLFAIFEVICGIITNSSAVLSDSIHNFADSLTVGIYYYFDKKATSKATSKYTYGYKRFTIVGELISFLVLFFCCILSILSAIPRLVNVESVNYSGLLVVSVTAIAINAFCAFSTKRSTNKISKKIHLYQVEDTLVWCAIFIASLCMKKFDLPILDPIISICIASYILAHALKHVGNIVTIFLEKVPDNISVDKLKFELLEKKHIKSIHDMHLWTVDGSTNYATMHIIVDSKIPHSTVMEIKAYIRERLQKYGITNVTIEVEYDIEEIFHEDEPDKIVENTSDS